MTIWTYLVNKLAPQIANKQNESVYKINCQNIDVWRRGDQRRSVERRVIFSHAPLQLGLLNARSTVKKSPLIHDVISDQRLACRH